MPNDTTVKLSREVIRRETQPGVPYDVVVKLIKDGEIVGMTGGLGGGYATAKLNIGVLGTMMLGKK